MPSDDMNDDEIEKIISKVTALRMCAFPPNQAANYFLKKYMIKFYDPIY